MSGDPRVRGTDTGGDKEKNDVTRAESARGLRAIENAHTASFNDDGREDGPAPSSVLAVKPGTILAGKYKVVRTIGKGGMGLVVEARHMSLDTRFAVKFLLPEFMSYAEAAGRFLREARAASKLASPHVARVHDVGTLEGGEPYMVMEYLAGEDLSYHAHAKMPLNVGEAIDYLVQACDAIAEAHDRGIIHRDIKPANLFLTKKPDGSPLVKVLDFGVSKVLGEGGSDVSLTQTTTILGSALYMAPEQMQSAKNVDARSDIYALGVCLFEMLGREQPYFAQSFPELCALIFTSAPKSLKALRPEVPTALVVVIEKALARSPVDRWQSVPELVQALSPFARMDTRQRIESLLRLHAPLLRLLPPAAMTTTASHAPPPQSTAATVVPADEPKRSRWRVFVALVAAGAAATLGWQQLRGAGPILTAPTEASSIAPSTAAPTDPEPTATASASATAAASAPVAPEASASAGAAASASATPAASASAPSASASAAASASARPKDAPIAKPAAPPFVPPPTPAPAPAPAPAGEKTPPPAVNPDLTQEICRVRLPDGTVKVVPCN